MPPGVYPYLSMEDYHNDPAIGSSGIKDLLISPLRYWFNSPRNPHRKPRKETPALKFGKGYHAMILEPDNFDKYVAVTPEKWIKAKNHPEKLSMEKQKDLWEEANASKTIITRAQYETMQEMAFALQVQPQHYNALRFGVPEVSIFWRDEETGLMCKVRPDRFSPTFVPDLKSTSDISDKNLRFEFPRRGYDISSAQYSEGMMQVRKMIKNGYKMPEPFTDEFVAEFMGQARQHFAIIWKKKRLTLPGLGALHLGASRSDTTNLEKGSILTKSTKTTRALGRRGFQWSKTLPKTWYHKRLIIKGVLWLREFNIRRKSRQISHRPSRG